MSALPKVTPEQAEQEVNDWLDHKKIARSKRERNKDSIDVLVDYVSEGTLVINEDKTIKHTLLFPIGADVEITELTYKGRINASLVQKMLQNVKANDIDGRLTAYAAALTTTPKDVIKKLDTEDYSIATSIAVFFM